MNILVRSYCFFWRFRRSIDGNGDSLFSGVSFWHSFSSFFYGLGATRPAMGKRRGRTGPGGAVVSSLSKKPGGTIRGRASDAHGNSSGQNSRQREDHELNELANLSSSSKKRTSQEVGSNASSSSGQSSGWLGKSPQQMLREWCNRNNRKRP